MATISAGSNAVIALQSGDYLEGTGAGLASIGAGGKLGVQPLRNGDPWQIGPFSGAQSVYISAFSLISYASMEIVQQPVSATDRLKYAQAQSLQSLLSVDGDVSSELLPSLTGIPGQTVRIMDGDNKGAILMWAVPVGASSYAWCWWLWPQAAY